LTVKESVLERIAIEAANKCHAWCLQQFRDDTVFSTWGLPSHPEFMQYQAGMCKIPTNDSSSQLLKAPQDACSRGIHADM